jgi:hypothetical protein
MSRMAQYFIMPGLVPGIKLRHRTKVGTSLNTRVKPGCDEWSSLADFSASLSKGQGAPASQSVSAFTGRAACPFPFA